jgi:hypothetical protein
MYVYNGGGKCNFPQRSGTEIDLKTCWNTVRSVKSEWRTARIQLLRPLNTNPEISTLCLKNPPTSFREQNKKKRVRKEEENATRKLCVR